MTWDEHLAKCKADALKLVNEGSLADAVATMAIDVTRHPEGPKDRITIDALVLVAMMDVANYDVQAVRRWIEGWH